MVTARDSPVGSIAAGRQRAPLGRSSSTPAQQRHMPLNQGVAPRGGMNEGLHPRGRQGNPQNPGYNNLTSLDRDARAHSPSGFAGRADCICDMCTCGSHRCPVHQGGHCPLHDGSREHALAGPSEYVDQYQRYPLPQRGNGLRQPTTRCPCGNVFPDDAAFCQRCGRQRVGNEDARRHVKFEGVASYASDYMAPPPEALKAAFQPRLGAGAPPEEWVPLGGMNAHLEKTTSYMDDYPWRQPAFDMSREARRGDTLAFVRVPFDGESSYHRDYYRKELPRPLQPFQRNSLANADLPLERFAGESEYVSSFPSHNVEPLRGQTPAGAWSPLQVSGQPRFIEDRDFATTSGATFVAPPPQADCPVRELFADYGAPSFPPEGRKHVYFDQGSKAWY